MSPHHSIKELSSAIRERAIELGFAACGFSRAVALPEDAARLKDWLNSGRHAGMAYMENHFEKRTDPTLLVEGALSVISLLHSYHTHRRQTAPDAPIVSTYAYGRDYHKVLKKKMNLLMADIRSMVPEAEGRIFVDSAPVLERAWARQSGLGWIGKNSHLISRSHGSYVFIGEIILNVELLFNQIPEHDFCGSCTRCIEACPTQAILDNRTLDAGLCISYQTIENKGEIDQAIRGRLDRRIFGCDICQEVCPWNRKAPLHTEPEFEPRTDWPKLSTQQWEGLEKKDFDR
ncbi:MAG: tRNA epoxyqueuosine(34) reductase QueG, partial [Bacteroidales bacterium]